jgi:hypothetical protein
MRVMRIVQVNAGLARSKDEYYASCLRAGVVDILTGTSIQTFETA